MSQTSQDAEAIVGAQLEVSEIFGNIADFWGFTRTQGRVYGLLFLSAKPLNHSEIRERLGISAGSASMTLASLVGWGVLRQRGRLYDAETDVWKVITGVFRRRENDQVEHAIERMSTVRERLREIEDPSADLSYALGRVDQLHDFFLLGRRLLQAFVSQSPIHGLLTMIAKRSAKSRPTLAAGGDATGH